MNPLTAIKLAAIAAVVAVMGFFWWQNERLQDRLAVATQAASEWEGHARGWMATARSSEALRGQEFDQAVSAITEADRSCDTRVERARKSATAIERIVTRDVPVDAANCPIRELIDHRSLCESVGAC